MASSTLDLLFKIKADSKDAQSDISKLRRTFETDVKAMESTGKNSFLALGNSMGLTSGQMAGIAKAAPLVASAVAAMGAAIVGAAVAVGFALFSLAKETAEFGSKINDASLKTGLTAETLSGLDLQLKQSGTSMEAFTRGVFLLQKNLTTMAESGKEGQKALAAIGLKPDQLKDTEVVLRAVLKHLAAIPDETARNAEGAKLMGRSYQELAVFLADTNGDIDAVIEKARELGLVMSGDAAKSADEFGDKLDELSNRASAAGRTIGTIVIPSLMQAIEQLNSSFKSIPDVAEGAMFAAGAAIGQWVTIPLQIAQAELLKLKNIFGTMGGFMAGFIADLNTPPESGGGDEFLGRMKRLSSGGAPRTGGGGRGGGGGGRSHRAVETEEDKAAKKAVDDLAKSQQMLTRYMEDQAAKVFEATTTIPKYLLGIVNLGLAMNKLGGTMADETRKLAIHNAVTLEAIKLAAQQQRALDDLNNVIITETSLVDALVTSAAAYGETLPPLIERALRLNAAHLDLVNTLERLKETFAEIDWDAMNPAAGQDPNAPVNVEMGEPPPNTMGGIDWGAVTAQIAESTGISISNIQKLGDIAISTFSQIAQAVGAAVRSFVLFGSAGTSLRKFAAEVIASVAQMAAVQAVFELAQGLARLALFFFFGDPKMMLAAKTHFAAAAMFGGIAAVAAVAGRVVAGNAFQQQGAGAGATAGGGGGTNARGYEAPESRTIERDRNQQPARQDVFLHVISDSAAVVKAFVADVRGNGELRQMLVLKGEV